MEYIQVQQFVYFARDIQIVGPKLLREPEVEIIYRSKSDALLPERCSVERAHASFSAMWQGQEDALQPLSGRHSPPSGEGVPQSGIAQGAEGALVCCWAELLIAWFVAVQALYKAFSSSLHHIFQYYATHAKEVACIALSPFVRCLSHHSPALCAYAGRHQKRPLEEAVRRLQVRVAQHHDGPPPVPVRSAPLSN
jgi:hypothetical protein